MFSDSKPRAGDHVSFRLTVLTGAAIGLIISVSILALMWLGVAGVLQTGSADLMYILWPSSLVLIGGWHTTTRGILITISSVAANCLMYAGLAMLLRSGVRALRETCSRT